MKAKQHAEVWDQVAEKATTTCKTMAGDRAVLLQTLAQFAGLVAESYRESDNAR